MWQLDVLHWYCTSSASSPLQPACREPALVVTNEKTVRRRFARCGDASPPTDGRAARRFAGGHRAAHRSQRRANGFQVARKKTAQSTSTPRVTQPSPHALPTCRRTPSRARARRQAGPAPGPWLRPQIRHATLRRCGCPWQCARCPGSGSQLACPGRCRRSRAAATPRTPAEPRAGLNRSPSRPQTSIPRVSRSPSRRCA